MQIRKYLNGELDAHAMHELERRAQDDPFLMDALDGYEQAKSDQQTSLDELSNRLQQRVVKKERRIIPWGALSIAASVLLVLGVAIWFFNGRQRPEKTTQLAQAVKIEQKEQPAISAPSPSATTPAENNNNITKQSPPSRHKNHNATADTQQVVVTEANRSPLVSEPVPNADVQAEALYKPKKDSVAANELVVKESQRKQAEADKLKEAPVAKNRVPASTETLVQSRVAGVSVTSDNNRTITGTVIGDDGQPLTGATVKVIGRPFGVVTDVHGKFTLADVSKDQTLAVNYIGYNSKKVKVNNGEALNISLQPASSSLSEVVVTKKDNSEVVAEDARPKDGWQSYNEYLKKNAQSPDGKTGKVKVSFVVAADGSLNQFKITKSLSDAADKKVIDLINNGPAWIGGTNGKPKEVKVSLSFK